MSTLNYEKLCLGSPCIRIRALVKFIQRTLHYQGQQKGAGERTIDLGKNYIVEGIIHISKKWLV